MAETRPAAPAPGGPAATTLAGHLGALALRDRLVAVLGPDGLGLRDANPAFCRLAGVPLPDLIAAGVVDLLTTTTSRTLAAEVAVAASGEPVSVRLTLRTAEQGVRLLKGDLHAVPGADAVVLVATDVTEAERVAALSRGTVDAVDRAQAVIEFDTTGRVLTANRNFLDVMGYSLPEVVGRHHRAFCEAAYTSTEAYAQFWEQLAAGEYVSGQFKRVTKDRREVWLQATYNPVLDVDGTVLKIVKIATDVTTATVQAAEHVSKVNAIERSQAVIEFTPEGRIITANKNFLDVVGYTLPEVVGKHHRVFCDEKVVESVAYQDFWERLGAGEYETGEYKRRGKDGRDVWLQATYNPVLDAEGKVARIIKFAADVTAAKAANAEFVGKVAAVDRSQAVVEFDLSGRVLTANPNFLAVMGYTLSEVVGKHHRMFCDPAHASSEAYATFWEQLGAGLYSAGEFERVTKSGRAVWLQATYNPILDSEGTPLKVVKFATDVTATKLATAEIASRMSAVDRSQAVIEFDLDGIVLAANENFLRCMGYSARELVGQHHSALCSEEYTRSVEYRDFWLRLSKGELLSGRFHRVGKFGRDVYIQASYNPVLDLKGDVVKVVKYAYDITDSVERERRVASSTADMTVSVRGLVGSTTDIAASSGVATDLAHETHANAEQGVEALRAALEAIDLIQRSSSSISKIVRVMGEIANQTNLLAFNASIEAARAGDHGVGFSIVAGEVRKLAERSSEAAQQIAHLIEESEDRVAQGAQVSKRAEQAFERIVTSVAKTNDAIRTISDRTRVQKETSETVNRLIAQIANQTGD
ncbi:PAS domain S-box protein [Kineococcus siccus]|uniref:methyl-accepting chemotaxis protein n=1 Tax=Kineococcus siccus TaxID=2696567 RepID=UPI00196AC605|nr:PAS domain S-box protein [Kineococcus siccus]